jgi:glycine/D-amino acid oxidase-like deaminating enzyme
VSAEASFSAGALRGPAAAAALAALAPAAALLPSLALGAKEQQQAPPSVSWGVRAAPPRSHRGPLPFVGRLDLPMLASTSEHPARPAVWLLAGLGSRGLVYHAWLAERLAQAVLSGDASELPRELSVPPPLGALPAGSAS